MIMCGRIKVGLLNLKFDAATRLFDMHHGAHRQEGSVWGHFEINIEIAKIVTQDMQISRNRQ